MAEKNEKDCAPRRKRVEILKRLIILTAVLLLLAPAVLCAVLFVKMGALEQRVQDLSGQARALREVVEELKADLKAEETEPGFIMEPASGEGTGDAGGRGLPDARAAAEALGAAAQAVSRIPDHYRKVYLTFDDGPSAETGKILDILAEYGVKATFFVVGKEDEKSQASLKRIAEEGHTLGMHSYSHKYGEVYESVEGFAADLTKLQEYLYDVTGVWSRVYRFPGGSSNTVSKVDMHEFIGYLNEQGIAYFDWNISSKDASRVLLSADAIVENCLSDLKKHKTAVILMHDSAAKKTTVEALPKLLEELTAMEETVILPITGDTAPVQHITNKEETEE